MRREAALPRSARCRDPVAGGSNPERTRIRRERIAVNLAKRYGLPTKVVTDCAVREAEKRAPETEIGVPAASLELVVVT